MDPVRHSRCTEGCTRDEAKLAFRAMLPSVHPDRGGDDAAFIRIRAAYERILAELDRRPPLMADAYRSRKHLTGTAPRRRQIRLLTRPPTTCGFVASEAMLRPDTPDPSTAISNAGS